MNKPKTMEHEMLRNYHLCKWGYLPQSYSLRISLVSIEFLSALLLSVDLKSRPHLFCQEIVILKHDLWIIQGNVVLCKVYTRYNSSLRRDEHRQIGRL